jgi:hypothetical protein
LRGIIEGPIDPDQAWFWTPAWQAGEREADQQLEANEGDVQRSTVTSCRDSFATGQRCAPTSRQGFSPRSNYSLPVSGIRTSIRASG